MLKALITSATAARISATVMSEMVVGIASVMVVVIVIVVVLMVIRVVRMIWIQEIWMASSHKRHVSGVISSVCIESVAV